jgi:hypothetical protein
MGTAIVLRQIINQLRGATYCGHFDGVMGVMRGMKSVDLNSACLDFTEWIPMGEAGELQVT